MPSSATTQEPPAKKARLFAPPSPALSQNSDMPVDDAEDDLYDSPAKPPIAETRLETESTIPQSLSPQPTSAGALPGLQLQHSTQDSTPMKRPLDEDNSDDAEYDPEEVDFYDEPTIAKNSDTSSNSTLAPEHTLNEPSAISSQINQEHSTTIAVKVERSPSPVAAANEAAAHTQPGAEDIKPNSSENSDLAAPHQANDVKEAVEPVHSRDANFLAVAKANRDNADAEFEYDSSADNTSDSSSDTSSSSSSDESDEPEYELLDPREQARILMQEEGGSDDEGGGRAAKAQQPRTANERPDIRVEKPNVEVTPEMKVVELGTVEAFVQDMEIVSLVVRGKTSGDVKVLDSGSVLCLESRTVIGAVGEILGRVQEPRYSVAFSNQTEIAALGIDLGTKIFYVPAHSEYVFTQSLKMLKGSDASNQFDEEVPVEEMEFSDDEAEAEHKRNIKQAKKAGKTTNGMQERLHDATYHDGTPTDPGAEPEQEQGPEYPSGPINYDDNDDAGDDLYTPLARPTNLTTHPIPPKPQFSRGNANRGRGNFERGHGFRGNGDRFDRGGRGSSGNRGGRGGRGEHRGGASQRNGGHKQHGDPRFRSDQSPNSFVPQPQMTRSSPPTQQNHSQGRQTFPQPSAQAMAGQSTGYPPSHLQANAQWNGPSSPVFVPTVGYPQHLPMSAHNIGYHQQPPAAMHTGPFGSMPTPFPPQIPFQGSLSPGTHINPAFFSNQSPPHSISPHSSHQQAWNATPYQPSPNYAMQNPGTSGMRMKGPPLPQPMPPNQGYDPSRPWMT